MNGIRQQLNLYKAYYRWLQNTLPSTMSLEACRQQVERLMESRDEQFLTLVRTQIFAHPNSPYLPLLRHADCTLYDIEQSVAQYGVEQTLEELRQAGVYFTLDEFKGDREVIRGNLRFHCQESDFDNPNPQPGVRVQSGGSRSAGTVTFLQFTYASETVPYFAFMLAEQGLFDLPTGLWYPILPAVSGFFKLMRLTFMGNPPRRWFTQIAGAGSGRINRDVWRTRAALGVAMFIGRPRGLRLPWPEQVPVDDANTIVDWMVKMRDSEGGCSLFTYPSSAVRVAQAATLAGRTLEATTFLVVGEPLTTAKRQAIEASGATVVNFYGFTELGIVGAACSRAASAPYHDDIHVFTDNLAVITQPRPVIAGGPEIPSLLFTSLLPHIAPKILLNVESGDSAIMECRECGCLFDELGWTTHMHHIQSFSKLSSEGLTFVGTDLVKVIDEVLPSRFGGSPTDYQFMEGEDENGFSKLWLVVSPTLGQVDEQAVRETLLSALATQGPRGRLSATLWQNTDTIQVRREYPHVTPVGKILPFHVERETVQ